MWTRRLAKTVAAVMTLTLCCTSVQGQEGEVALSFQTETGICKGIKKGDRVRISVNAEYARELSDYLAEYTREVSDYLEEDGKITGKLVSCSEEVLLVKPKYRWSSADPLRIPADNVDGVEVSQGGSSHTLAGAGIGLVAGVVLGVLMQKHEASDEMFAGLNEGFNNAGRVAGGAVVGALVGAMVGSLISSEKWEKVYGDYSISLLERNPTGEYQVAFGFSF